MKVRLFALICFCLIFSRCFFFYTFSGTSIPAEAETFFIQTFDENLNGIYTPPPTLYQDFTDALIDKVKNESSLVQTNTDPDIEFKGSFTRFNVSYVAPKGGEEVSFNRLEVSISVEYIYKHDDEQNWTKTFSFFSDFDVSDNLIDVQEGLLEEIVEQLIEDIFNKAFTNW